MTFGIFLLLCIVVIWAIWSLRQNQRTLLRVGMGGPEENLDQARSLMKRITRDLLAFVCGLAGTIASGERWSQAWRNWPMARAVLFSIAVALAVGVIISMSRSQRAWWSRTGSIKVWAINSFTYLGLGLMLILTLRWTFG